MVVANVPFRLPRLAALSLAFVFGVVGFAMGINALVKSNDQKDLVKKQAAPLGATVNIDTDDVFDVGCVVTVVCALVALTSLASLVSLLFARSARAFTFLGLFLSFLTIWLFASLVPMTDFVANRQAKVSAFLGTVPLPDSIIQTVQQQLGVTSVYRDIHYLRLAVILPWIAFLFSAIASALELMAARRVRNAPLVDNTTAPAMTSTEPAPSYKEKGDANVEQVQV
ncbi:hypothetical protein PYCCODRAFT_1357883 [Trametes coccinea BRFM310]|uniref:Uncharacterized protein n=1 Tax=Trametes coccinea (strain BRFM310) TaxID=1353009 RepID=A0A1Y2J6S3_TRAC3|nr:hypothetical protein PYCCODRAFT_1357883 [Trametes coccinea BRFM310]